MSSQPLLPSNHPEHIASVIASKRRILFTTILTTVLLIAGIIFVSVKGEGVPSSKDPLKLANYYLKSSPVIDGHIDLPIFARAGFGNNIDNMDLYGDLKNRYGLISHLNIPKARKGHLGGFFWSIYIDCPKDAGPDFLTPYNGPRDTLEQIDVAMNLMDKYSDVFQLCKTADEVMEAVASGKIASLMGMEGAHSLGNSLGALRMFHALGVRYMTLTHGCNNAFADSGGIFQPVTPHWGGLSDLGKDLIFEMNRLGVFIDLSHVSDQTALDALSITRAPVILSHSCARAFNNISRNVPDEVLSKLGRGKHKVDGVVMVNFLPTFAAPGGVGVDVKTIADHVEYIASKTSRDHVGIGSDFDGIDAVPRGLEDVSMYPNLFAELITRGWKQDELAGLAGGNLLRAMRGMEATSLKMKQEGKKPSMAVYAKRTDL
ncbi:membrane dipeptidase-domain-containing protein [Kockovaella imperatae]|uniref:Dipeptidase n=1 Tax=Kockovaella imperatae TaxID=4999 RepID=A0A1Y1U9M4_9TREE|nr:membrane dipeptidase-domain-containing protein [Kockovaella imperatae]ORX34206.1 membrane dipeptidase-domain-containing protein [Kockovaella imperatae]